MDITLLVASSTATSIDDGTVESWEEKKRRGMVTALLTGGLKKMAADSGLKKTATETWSYY